jgi:putative ABC transport system permease protein
MRAILQDLRYAARQLLKQRVFAITAILTLALGIGAATTVFSVAYGVLIDPFPYKDVHTLVTPKLCASRWSVCHWNVYSPSGILEITRNTTIFTGVTGSTISDVVLTGTGEPMRLRGNYITPNTFDVLGVQPLIGRASTDSDVAAGHSEVALLSYRYWQAHFGGSPSVLGRTLTFNNHPRTVIGVMPPRFLWRGGDVYLPIQLTSAESIEDQSTFALVARLKPGLTVASVAQQATAELTPVFQDLAHQHPRAYPEDLRVGLMPFDEMFQSGLANTLYLLLGAVGLLLLIACVNVSSLLLARAVQREHEFVLRAAIGASRRHLLRSAFVESLLLALVSMPVAIAFAWLGLQATLRIVPTETIPDEALVSMNLPVLAASLAVGLITVLLFGLAPAWHSANPRLAAALNASRSSGSRAQRRLLSGFVITEIALSFALLTLAGLTVRNLLAVENVPLPVDPEHTLLMRLPLSSQRYPNTTTQNTFHRQLLDSIRTLPGVKNATIDASYPFMDFSGDVIQLPGQPVEKRPVNIHLTTPEYLSVAPGNLLAGHFLDEREINQAAHEAVVTESFVNRYFPNQSPLNKTFHIPSAKTMPKNALADDSFTIVGVLQDIPYFPGFSEQFPQVFLPYTLFPAADDLIVSTNLPANELLHTIRQAVYAIDPDQPIVQPMSFRQMLDMYGYAGPRFLLALFSTFAASAMLLSLVGIYGVLSFVTTQRTQEIGIRMALGANRSTVMTLILRHASTLAIIGVASGLPLAYLAARLAHSELSYTNPNVSLDPIALIAAILALPLLALLGAWLPARRASKVEPIQALRAE